jgi:class 3 adenylate cyclase
MAVQHISAAVARSSENAVSEGFRGHPRNLIEWAGGPRATLAVVFTDIVGSTSLGVQLKDESMEEIRDAHFSRGRDLLTQYAGREVKTVGDGIMALFRSVGDAFDFSLAIHLDPGRPELQVRAAIHIGEIDVREDDVFGTEVNFGARVGQKIEGAEIWLSDQAKLAIDRRGASHHRELRWDQHGHLELKGFPGSYTLWSLVLSDAEEPSLPAPEVADAPALIRPPLTLAGEGRLRTGGAGRAKWPLAVISLAGAAAVAIGLSLVYVVPNFQPPAPAMASDQPKATPMPLPTKPVPADLPGSVKMATTENSTAAIVSSDGQRVPPAPVESPGKERADAKLGGGDNIATGSPKTSPEGSPTQSPPRLAALSAPPEQRSTLSGPSLSAPPMINETPSAPKPDIQGVVQKIAGASRFMVGNQWIELQGIDDPSTDGKHNSVIYAYLKPSAGMVECHQKSTGRYQCYAGSEDLAVLALRNGFARLRSDAPPEYIALAPHATSARK